MTRSADYAELKRLGLPVLTTEDAALRLRLSSAGASHLLRRLAEEGLVFPLRRGLWSLESKLDRLVLGPYLTAPYPSYVSLQSALFLHGVISQIPQVTYLCSLSSTETIETSLGVFSVHRISPEFFGGFESDKGHLLACPEKALLDVLYLSRTRSRLFAVLPELELPRGFSSKICEKWIAKLGPKDRTMVGMRLEEILKEHRPSTSRKTRTRS